MTSTSKRSGPSTMTPRVARSSTTTRPSPHPGSDDLRGVAGEGLKGGVAAQRIEEGEREPVGVDLLCRGLAGLEEGGGAVADEDVDDRGLVGELAVVGAEPQGLLDGFQGLFGLPQMGERLSLDGEGVPVARRGLAGRQPGIERAVLRGAAEESEAGR